MRRTLAHQISARPGTSPRDVFFTPSVGCGRAKTPDTMFGNAGMSRCHLRAPASPQRESMSDISPGTVSRYSGRSPEPRRFAWWFGYPFLALGALAWALQENRLVAPVIFLFGAAGVALAVDGIRTGVVEVKFGKYSRVRDPINFWFHVTVFIVLGVAMLVAGSVRLLT